jgi:hypothetical protein
LNRYLSFLPFETADLMEGLGARAALHKAHIFHIHAEVDAGELILIGVAVPIKSFGEHRR